jgi:hypothetical protein
MSVTRYQEQAYHYRAIASRADSDEYRRWANHCADLLEAQAEMLNLYGRCPDVDLPGRPGPRD